MTTGKAVVDWEPTLVLPNVDFVDSVGSRLVAIAGIDDTRIQDLRERHPTFDTFLSRFTDEFNVPVKPSIVLVAKSAPQSVFTIDAISSFRDIVALSAVPLSRALQLQYDKPFSFQYSNSFALYPWSLSRDYKHLVLNTGALTSMNAVDKFQGQSSPEVSFQRVRVSDFDAVLLAKLIKRWKSRYATQKTKWEDRALFRSLNMANQAAQIPWSADETRYDRGRITALWVSAFEILVHPGRGGRSGPEQVLNLLERVQWVTTFLSMRVYKVQSGKKASRRGFASSVYEQMYSARNDFLHGNPVRPSGLYLKGTKVPLWYCAALLYRLGLTAFLDLSWKKPWPSRSNSKRFAKMASDRYDFERPQGTIEQGLYYATKPRPE